MEAKNDNDIILKDDEGKEYLFKIYFTFENEEKNTKYAFIYDESDPDNILPMKYDDEGNMFPVEDEDELEDCQEVLDAYENDESIQAMKKD